jgi:hypothetical protein
VILNILAWGPDKQTHCTDALMRSETSTQEKASCFNNSQKLDRPIHSNNQKTVNSFAICGNAKREKLWSMPLHQWLEEDKIKHTSRYNANICKETAPWHILKQRPRYSVINHAFHEAYVSWTNVMHYKLNLQTLCMHIKLITTEFRDSTANWSSNSYQLHWKENAMPQAGKS